MRLILCFFAIHLIFFKSNADSSNYKIDLSGNGKSDKRKVDVISSDNLVVFNVFDQFGIGEAQVEKIKGEWPKRILVRCHFSGLEEFTLILKDMSYKKNTLKCRMCDPKGKELKGKYLLDNEGGVSKKIPGYFEIEIPTKIISDSDRFKLKWIDFYR